MNYYHQNIILSTITNHYYVTIPTTTKSITITHLNHQDLSISALYTIIKTSYDTHAYQILYHPTIIITIIISYVKNIIIDPYYYYD